MTRRRGETRGDLRSIFFLITLLCDEVEGEPNGMGEPKRLLRVFLGLFGSHLSVLVRLCCESRACKRYTGRRGPVHVDSSGARSRTNPGDPRLGAAGAAGGAALDRQPLRYARWSLTSIHRDSRQGPSAPPRLALRRRIRFASQAGHQLEHHSSVKHTGGCFGSATRRAGFGQLLRSFGLFRICLLLPIA